MKIYIDDIRPAPEGWRLIKTVTEAIRIIYYDGLFGDPITHISLDHDISHPVTVGSLQRPYPCEETYAAVAYFIAEHYKHKVIAKEIGARMTCLSIDCPERSGGECRTAMIPEITLHTSNIVGAENMQLILSKHGIPVTIKLSPPVTRPQPKI
jgi:hypothetical protein